MNRKQLIREINGFGFADLEDNFRVALLGELQSGFEYFNLEDAKEYRDKCWFNENAIPRSSWPGHELMGYFIPKIYLS